MALTNSGAIWTEHQSVAQPISFGRIVAVDGQPDTYTLDTTGVVAGSLVDDGTGNYTLTIGDTSGTGRVVVVHENLYLLPR